MVKKSLIFLNRIKVFSFAEITMIKNYFKDTDEIFKAQKEDLLKAGFKPRSIDSIYILRKSSYLDQELDRINKENITILSIFDKDYPPRLKERDLTPYPP